MALSNVWGYANSPLLVLVIAAVLRWGWRIDRGINASVNNAVLLRQQLEAHEKINEVQFEEANRRLDRLEDVSRWAG